MGKYEDGRALGNEVQKRPTQAQFRIVSTTRGKVRLCLKTGRSRSWLSHQKQRPLQKQSETVF